MLQPSAPPHTVLNGETSSPTRPQIALIIGAGPAGLTAALELLRRTKNVRPVVLEKSSDMGGISRTIKYKGNRIDIGGHRFFSKSDRVMEWWLEQMPMEPPSDAQVSIRYQGASRLVSTTERDREQADAERVMLVRQRKSRIYYLRKFFDYPISLSPDTLQKLGTARTLRVGLSYLNSVVRPIRNETSLEHFFINRFGKELYLTFFKSYTEKVWGESCSSISAEWGAQRIKGLSIGRALKHFARKVRPGARPSSGIAQKDTETSLIEQFLYPKYGPGQMWETVAREVCDLGGEIITEAKVTGLTTEGNRVTGITVARKGTDGTVTCEHLRGAYVLSTMPIKELIRAWNGPVPVNVKEVSEGLIYRDFITVGMLLDRLKIHDETPQGQQLIRDNWIYIQEPDVQLGRLQIFNNWSPHLVADPSKVWVGLEYFCYETDAIWKLSDEEMIRLAREELEKIGIIEQTDVRDATVIRVPKTYPAYFGSYNRFGELRSFLDCFENLFLIGRNGMHKYNNQDHSMLTAMTAVDNIVEGRTDKANLWEVNTEQEYHEDKAKEPQHQSKGDSLPTGAHPPVRA